MKRKALRPALQVTVPVFFGYLFLGIAFGVLLQQAGFGPFWAFLSSLTIYAGSGQFLLISLFTANASLVTTAVMTLLVNCRHIFYGLSFLEQFRNMGKAMPYMIFSMTDETYSLLCGAKVPPDVNKNDFFFWIALLDHCYWILGSVAGAVLGSLLTFDTTGIDFAMTALFTVICVEQWESYKTHLPAIIGFVCSAAALILFGATGFILPAMLAICALLLLFRERIGKGVLE